MDCLYDDDECRPPEPARITTRFEAWCINVWRTSRRRAARPGGVRTNHISTAFSPCRSLQGPGIRQRQVAGKLPGRVRKLSTATEQTVWLCAGAVLASWGINVLQLRDSAALLSLPVYGKPLRDNTGIGSPGNCDAK